MSDPAQMTSSRLADAERPALLAERPAERVGEVALARAVGPDDGADPAAELDERPLGERLEALDAEREEPGRRAIARRRSCRPPLALASAATRSRPARSTFAARSAARSARIASSACGRGRRLGVAARRPLADAEDLAVDPDLDPERLLVVRARSPRRAGSRAARRMRRWVYSCRRLFGLLSEQARRLERQLGLGQRREPVARRLPAEVEVEGAGQRLERRREERRAAAAAALGLALAEQQVRRRGRCGRRAGPGRRSRRSRRGAPTGRPRRRSGWRA